MTLLSAVGQVIRGTVAALGPILGAVVVLTVGIAVGAALGAVVGIGYRWVRRPADEDETLGLTVDLDDLPSLDSDDLPSLDSDDLPSLDSDDLPGVDSDDLPGDLTRGRLVAVVAVVGTVAVGGPATTSAFATVIRGAVASFGPVVGGLLVVVGGIGVGAALGAVVGVSYVWWSESSLGDESSMGEAAERPSVTTPDVDHDDLVPEVSTDLPRRQVLGTVAAVGGAAALGGLTTSAFYRDREQYANNQVVTGELDLKVDWQEHYSDWSDDETEGIEFSMTDSSVGPGFPSAASEKFVYVSDADQFLENTAVEAFPDVLPDSGATDDALQATIDPDSKICSLEADADEGALASNLRTTGTFGGQTTETGDPLVDISDVKPGDFGEVTFSLHLCGNPGFVWLTGGLQSESENGADDPEDDASGEGSGVELTDAIQAAIWYDTGEDGSYGVNVDDRDAGEGDNFKQSGEKPSLFRGSLRDALTLVSSGDGLPLDGKPGTDEGEAGRECFQNSTTGYVGFEWWIPEDVGNEIQTDSVRFDLGFYTEQCRHNDGFGNDGGAGGAGGSDNGGDGDVEGQGAISFLAACVDSDRSVTESAANFRVTTVLDRDGEGTPTAVEWETDVGVDSVVAAYGSNGSKFGGVNGPKFTTYQFDSPQTSGTVVTGADEDGSIGDEDGSPETTVRKPKSGDEDQTSDKPCPDGKSLVEKLKKSSQIDPS